MSINFCKKFNSITEICGYSECIILHVLHTYTLSLICESDVFFLFSRNRIRNKQLFYHHWTSKCCTWRFFLDYKTCDIDSNWNIFPNILSYKICKYSIARYSLERANRITDMTWMVIVDACIISSCKNCKHMKPNLFVYPWNLINDSHIEFSCIMCHAE